MLQMKVKVVGIDQNTMMPVVIITDTDEKGFIPILIGQAEANAILYELEGIKPPRPITHDLLKNLVDAFNAKVDRIVICDIQNETYFARIVLKSKDGQTDVDARPSDAIALALRTGAPIYITEEVASKALSDSESATVDPEMEEFRRFLDRFLENLSPGRF